MFTDNAVRGIMSIIKRLSDARGFFAAAPRGLAFSNSVFVTVSANGVRAEPLGPQHRARQTVPFTYEPTADMGPVWEWVEAYFAGDADAHEKAQFLQEIFGASLARVATKFQRCALLLGEGSNGKDTCIEVLKSVFPSGTVSYAPPQTWGGEYVRASLSGKWLNVVSELPGRELATSEAFKAIVAGNPTDARFPKGRVFTLTPEAGHIFALNKMMGTQDLSHGFFRRFGILRFAREFSDTTSRRDVAAEMVAHRPAIALWLLEGAANLLARGHYVLPTSHGGEMTEWRLEADQVATFLAEDCADSERGMRASELYVYYTDWALRAGHRACNRQNFIKRMRELLKRRAGRQPWHSNGLRFPLVARAGDKPEGLAGLPPQDLRKISDN